jgi:hypothetical protein
VGLTDRLRPEKPAPTPLPSNIRVDVYLHNDDTAEKLQQLTDLITALFAGDPAKIMALAKTLGEGTTSLAAAVEAATPKNP